MNNDKVKEKIRKLLRLAQSNEPHEAERARVQSEKLMAKHNLHEDDLEIVQKIATRFIVGRRPPASCHLLLAAVEHISGCFSLFECRYELFKKGTGLNIAISQEPFTLDFFLSGNIPKPSFEYRHDTDQYEWRCYPKFIGIESDATIATYCWDVLYEQLEAKRKRLRKILPANKIEDYSFGFVVGSVGKLVNAFGHKKKSKQIETFVEKYITENNLKADKFDLDDMEIDANLASSGANDGQSARLFAGTRDDRVKNYLNSGENDVEK